LKRGDISAVAGGKDYAGNPRPLVIVEDDSFDATASIIICTFTNDETDAPLYRLPVQSSERNGLHAVCRLVADISTSKATLEVDSSLALIAEILAIPCGRHAETLQECASQRRR